MFLFGLEVKNPYSIWLQISSFSFMMAGNFSDLLIIRLCLSAAYIFLFLNSALGAPLWPLWHIHGKIQLDGILWASINLYVHISTVIRLLKDERRVILSEDEQALWRMFYRTGGLSQCMFKKHVANYCNVVTYQHNDEINTDHYFYIIYQGTVQLTVTDENGALVSSREAQSGQIFDFRALGLLVEHKSLAKHKLQAVVAVSNVKLFRFSKDKIRIIANHPSTRLMWKEILMENLLRIVQRYFDKRMRCRNTLNGKDQYINSIFAPLEEHEYPHPLRAGSTTALKYPFRHIIASMKWSFAPPWPFQGPPEGLRHNQLLIGAGTRGSGGRVRNIPPKKLLNTSENKHPTHWPLLRRSETGNTDDADDISNHSSEYHSIQLSNNHDDNDNTTTTTNNNGSCNSVGSHDASQNDEDGFEYLMGIDEEMGGLNDLGFKRATSVNKK